MTTIARIYAGETPIEYPKRECCFFTGHRDYNFSPEGEKQLLGVVTRLYESGIRHFYAGGALGFDLAAEITVCNFKLSRPEATLSLALPYDGYVHGGYSPQTLQYCSVLRSSDEVIWLARSYSGETFHMRNRFMADRCGICVAYLEKGYGGTYSTVSYARTACEKVYNLAAGRITELN